jgi:hypothetical protein
MEYTSSTFHELIDVLPLASTMAVVDRQSIVDVRPSDARRTS